MSEQTVYLGGQFIPASEAKLDLHDVGVLSGVAITDMTRTFRLYMLIVRSIFTYWKVVEEQRKATVL